MTKEIKKDKRKLLESYSEHQPSHQFGPEQIVEMNASLPDNTITLFLPPDFDKKLIPVKARALRNWWEDDEKTRMHARFCLPLTMASGLGYYILSPATFTVEWDGVQTHDCEVTIEDAASHAIIDNHSAFASFTVQGRFIARTKNLGDFVFIKGVANQVRQPFHVMEAMIESWWSPSEFGIVCLVNQPGKFTIKKGEPLAQMFVVNVQQAQYALGTVTGYPPFWDEWTARRDPKIYDGRNMDYLRGVLPDQTPVCPHLKGWTETNLKENQDAHEISPRDYFDLARTALDQHNSADEAERQFMLSVQHAEKRDEINHDLMNDFLDLAYDMQSKGHLKQSVRIFQKWIALSERYYAPGLERTSDVFTDMAWSLRELREFDAAIKALKESLQRKRSEKVDSISLAKTLIALGTIHDYIGRRTEARPYLEEAKAIYETELPADDVEHLYLKNVYGCLLSHIGEFEPAQKLFDEVVEERSRLFGEDSLEVAFTYNDLGFHYRDQDDLEKSEYYFSKCIENRKSHLGESASETLSAMNDLGWMFKDSKKYKDGLKVFEAMLAVQQKVLYPRDPQIRDTLRCIADCYKGLGKADLADKAMRKSNAI